MTKSRLLASLVLVLSGFYAWGEPGGSYTLTGEEKGIEAIIKADMERFPELYEGVDPRSYLKEFKKKNRIGERKFAAGDILYFPDTPASLRVKNETTPVQNESPADSNEELPVNFKFDHLPSVVQEGSYCVPACGEWIAKFHGIETDQWEIAKLSSQGSMDNAGTNPLDMAHVMENFGFSYRLINDRHTDGDVEDFVAKTLPLLKEALVREGPMYISFMPGIFGSSGHGCVVIGYSDTRNEMYFYNPWGTEYSAPYREVEKYTRTVIAFTPPKALGDASVDCTALIKGLKQALPNHKTDVVKLQVALSITGVSFKYIECNRRDLMDDAKKTERLARRESQKFIDLAIERAPAILIPQTDDKGVTDYLFIRKSPESKKKLLVQRIDAKGWGEPELTDSKGLVRYWTTPVAVKPGQTQWMLPLFEFSGEVRLKVTSH